MKPAWDKLMTNWNKGDRVKTSLIADVDCTAAGKELCDTVGVRGFPSIKWGDPIAMEDYKGGRDYDALNKFAEDNLKPMCSPANLDLCDDEKKSRDCGSAGTTRGGIGYQNHREEGGYEGGRGALRNQRQRT